MRERRKVKRRRPYTKVRRAAAEEETRQRIVEALMELHAEVGPARTTVSAVAERAGVERLTVYRHFPDEQSMFRACSALYMERNPPPEPALGNLDAATAIRRTLVAVYSWYRTNEAMFSNVLGDLERMESLQESTEELRRYVASLASQLDHLFERRSAQRRATLHHALEFNTWRSLSRLTPHDRAAAEVAATWLAAEL